VIRLSDVPIRRKLAIITGVASGVALLLAGAVFVAYDRVSVEQAIVRRQAGIAEIVAYNSATAIVFRDPTSAGTTLAALAPDVHVIAACIYVADGTLFASHVGKGSTEEACPSRIESAAPVRSTADGVVTVAQPIVFEGKMVGTVVVRSDLAERDERLQTYIAVVALVSLVTLVLAVAIVGRLGRRSIFEPLVELSDAARRIAEHEDYGARVTPRGRDEVGSLVAAFNHMSEALHRRDAELRTAQQELERRIREADQASRLKDEFLATLSHELRTPLNAIVGWAQLLRTGLDPVATERALETINRNALTQSQIVADILDMQRITTGRLRLNLRDLRLPLVIERAVDTIGPAAAAKEITVQTVIEPDAGPVLGDEDRLQQVLWNLLSNAVKFTPRGGRIRVGLRSVNSHVEVSVEDTGPGLDPAFIPFAFDRFRQADSSSTRRHGGLGLGLAIVRSLVESHGGSVAVVNRSVGTGALFLVTLPRMSVRPAGAVPALETRHPTAEDGLGMSAAPSLHAVKVLVVDDELDSRELIAAALSQCGAEVTSVGSADEAIAALKRVAPHVLISDIEMPGEDGYSLIRRVRRLSRAEGGETPAAALTAYAATEDRVRALGAGFQMHVPKPVQPAELAAVVASLARRPLATA
jgi:signal transduction histidine kinase/ActR/RegA family two-component response regulator